MCSWELIKVIEKMNKKEKKTCLSFSFDDSDNGPYEMYITLHAKWR